MVRMKKKCALVLQTLLALLLFAGLGTVAFAGASANPLTGGNTKPVVLIMGCLLLVSVVLIVVYVIQSHKKK